MNGKKLAAAGAALQWVRGTGAAPVESNMTLYYNDAKTGVIDGFMIFPSAIPGMKYPEAAPFVTKVGFGAQYAAALIINKSVYDGLPPELQTILREAAQAWTATAVRGAAGHLRQGLWLGGGELPRRDEFRAAARGAGQVGCGHAEHRQGMGGAHRRRRDCPAPRFSPPTWTNCAAQAPIRCATGTRTDAVARCVPDATVDAEPRPVEVDEGAPEGGVPRASIFGSVTQGLNIVGTLLILAMAVAVNADAIGRNLFNHPIPGVLEFLGLSIVAIVFLQMANTLREGRHVSNDLLTQLVTQVAAAPAGRDLCRRSMLSARC